MAAKTRYLVTLKFRVYPLSLSLSNPNELSQELTPLDGALAFAEYYQDRLSKMSDWRVQYLEDTLTSDRLEWKSEIRSSYLLPAVSKGKTIEILTPMGFSAVFKIDSEAHYKFSQKTVLDILSLLKYSLDLGDGMISLKLKYYVGL